MLAVPTLRAVVPTLSEEGQSDLAQIPGVRVRAKRGGGVEVLATADVAQVVGGEIGLALIGEAARCREVDAGRLGAGLTDYKREAALSLAEGRARLLWWSCGIGKSATYLAAADLVAPPPGRVLIVTRAMGREVFARDSVLLAKRHRVAVVVGEGVREFTVPSAAQRAAVRRADRSLQRQRDRGADCVATASVQDALDQDAWAVVVSWETLAAHEASILSARFNVVIFDEHHCGKGRGARRATAAHRIAAQAPVVWGGTATPVPDRVRDLWGQLHSVGGRSAWGTSLKFAKRYAHAVPGRFGGYDSDGPHRIGCAFCARATAELKRRLPWWADMRNRRVIAHLLPTATRALIHVPPVGDLSDGEDRSARGGIEGAVSRAAGAKLKSVAARAAEALVAGEKLCVVGNRRSWVPRMARSIEGALPAGLRRGGRVWIRQATGEMDVAARLAIASEFLSLRTGHAEGEHRAAVLVATIDSIRTSIDLHDADRVMVAALPWTPEALEQLEGRFRRLGQVRPVQYDYFIAEGTIDERIAEALLAKMECIGRAGAEVDPEGRAWLAGQQPGEDEVLAGLRAWLSADADAADRAEAEAV